MSIKIFEMTDSELEKEVARLYTDYTKEKIDELSFIGVGINYTTSWYPLMPLVIEHRLVLDFDRDSVYTVLGPIIDIDVENHRRSICELLVMIASEYST